MHEQLSFTLDLRSLDEARATGEQAASRCLSKAEASGFDSAGAGRFICDHLRQHGATSGEDLVAAAKARGFVPKEDRAYGGVFLGLKRRKLIVCLRSDLPRAHGNGTSGGKLWAAAGAVQ